MHPISNAFMNYAKDNKIDIIDVDKFNNLSGIGLTATLNNKNYYIGNNKILSKFNIDNPFINDENDLSKNGNSIVYVVEDKKIIALIGVKDIVRDNAKKVIKELKSLNKRVIMLTGDNEITARYIASDLDIEEVVANVMPKDKTNKIKELMNNNQKVLMVGDGINDAPSLATATIGVSISSGTDIANNSSDVILMNDNLMSLINLITISQKTIKNIKQNLFWAFFYNICMIPIAIGIFEKWNIFMNPMVAGFAMTISSLTVVFNALRLKKIKLRRD
jgi:Cu+-exporting ATPase